MVFNVIPFFIIILCLAVIVYIIGRKIPQLRILDVGTITEAKESRLKKKILEQRWSRAIGQFKNISAKILKPLVGNFFYVFKIFYQRVIELEKIYKKEVSRRQEETLDVSTRLENYLVTGKSYHEKKMFKEAEESYIKALEIDDKCVEAYTGLGETYLEIRDTVKAKETFAFLIKLLTVYHAEDVNAKNMLAHTYATLGEIEREMHHDRAALKHFKKAVDLDSNNPRFLDLLLNSSIILKDKKLSVNTLQKLKRVNPENNKIAEYEKQIEILT